MNVLILGVLAHPRDHDVLVISEHQVHPPGAVEAPLTYPVICTRVGAHPNPACLASAMAEFLNGTIEALLGFAAQRFDALVTAPRDGDAEPWRHQPSRMIRSEIHGVAGESVLQALPRSRLLQRPLISRLPQQLRETALVLRQRAQPGQALL